MAIKSTPSDGTDTFYIWINCLFRINHWVSTYPKCKRSSSLSPCFCGEQWVSPYTLRYITKRYIKVYLTSSTRPARQEKLLKIMAPLQMSTDVGLEASNPQSPNSWGPTLINLRPAVMSMTNVSKSVAIPISRALSRGAITTSGSACTRFATTWQQRANLYSVWSWNLSAGPTPGVSTKQWSNSAITPTPTPKRGTADAKLPMPTVKRISMETKNDLIQNSLYQFFSPLLR